ncbi:MAG: alpha/beta fold hydrolase [bacterium]
MNGAWVNVDGVRIYVERKGSGAPLLLIPGLGAGTWLWRRSAAALAREFKLIMPELRGSGRSDKPDHRYSIALFAADLVGLLTEMGISKAHLLGVSMGGFVAQYLAAKYPEKVISLILAATSPGGDEAIGPDGDVLSRTIRPRGKTRKERLEDGYAFNFTPEFIRRNPEQLERITAWRTQYPQAEFAYYRQLLAGNAYDGTGVARDISVPTLICAGKEDPLVPLDDVFLLQEKIPHAALKIFEGKHLFFFEHYREFNREILDFLKKVRADREDETVNSVTSLRQSEA